MIAPSAEELLTFNLAFVVEVVPTASRPDASSVIACVKLMAFPAVPEAAMFQTC
jgi:hypothetical protein